MTKSQSEVGSKETIARRDAAVGPVQSGTSIPVAPLCANPQAGARTVPGKSNTPTAVLYGNDPGTRSVTAVRQAEEVKGAARKAIDTQVAGDDTNSPNGNPKRRTRNRWGTADNAGN